MRNIAFISFNEPNADNNWELLHNRFPEAIRVHGVKGIHNAHRTAAQTFNNKIDPYVKSLLAISGNANPCLGYKHFWVVDGDSTLDENFNFEMPDNLIVDAVYVYKATNPINELSYGYGGVKLLPIAQTLAVDVESIDMTTSLSDKVIVVDKTASVTNFNTDSFNTWKSAFRECVKLSARIIPNQLDRETLFRLKIWCAVGADSEYGEWAIKGAMAGNKYGKLNRDNHDALLLINDFDFLKTLFDKEDT
jgi:hypothetical protein